MFLMHQVLQEETASFMSIESIEKKNFLLKYQERKSSILSQKLKICKKQTYDQFY